MALYWEERDETQVLRYKVLLSSRESPPSYDNQLIFCDPHSDAIMLYLSSNIF